MEVHHITVVGAGTMGHGIAQVAAMAGYNTCLNDISEAAVTKGFKVLCSNLAKGVEKGKLTASAMDEALSRISLGFDLAADVANADLVIEAAPEVPAIKSSIFKTVEASAGPECVIASNTSSLSIAGLAESVSNPSRVIGMHFFNPVHIMALLEIVVAESTGTSTLEVAKAVGERMGKTSIVVKDFPGFATSRLGVVLGLEAMRMVEQGVASAQDIDTAMELGYRHPMGPLKLTDLVGLDVRLGIAEYLHRELASEAFKPPQILRDLVAQGRLGKKSGHGFYPW